MPLGKEVGLVPGHIVLDGDPVGTQRPHAQQPLPTFRPTLFWHGRPSQQLLCSCLNMSSAVAKMGDGLATIDISRKLGVLCPFSLAGGWVLI